MTGVGDARSVLRRRVDGSTRVELFWFFRRATTARSNVFWPTHALFQGLCQLRAFETMVPKKEMKRGLEIDPFRLERPLSTVSIRTASRDKLVE